MTLQSEIDEVIHQWNIGEMSMWDVIAGFSDLIDGPHTVQEVLNALPWPFDSIMAEHIGGFRNTTPETLCVFSGGCWESGEARAKAEQKQRHHFFAVSYPKMLVWFASNPNPPLVLPSVRLWRRHPRPTTIAHRRTEEFKKLRKKVRAATQMMAEIEHEREVAEPSR